MPQPTAVINIVGLTGSLIGEHTPRIAAFARRPGMAITRLKPVLPAVTCSVQASMLTGRPPREHGIVGNGWFDRALGEVHFWKQSNRLVRGEKVWDAARRRDPSVTCANLFWWFNMGSTVDVSVTPRPIYKADGRKIPDLYTEPPDLRDVLQDELGRFPLFQFWGPGAGIESSRWISRASKRVIERFRPALTLIYLPHLDYDLQRFGPSPGEPRVAAALRDIDSIAGDLIDSCESRGVRVILFSEYGLEPVDDSIHINRILREAGLLRVREEDGLDLLDPIGSSAFAVVDHQIAHVSIREAQHVAQVAALCRGVSGVEAALDRAAQRAHGIDHERAGDLVLIAAPRRWFSYDYWLDEARAPDFARTVDIHRKPGYDPCELLLDPRLRWPKLHIARRLLQKKLGLRMLMDVIPLDPSLVRGSHGRTDQPAGAMPVLIARESLTRGADEVPCTAVHDVIIGQMFTTLDGSTAL